MALSEVTPGAEWKNEIDKDLNRAQVILLSIIPSFIESKNCYGVEGQKALSRSESKEAIMIPSILRSYALGDPPFGKLQALPLDAHLYQLRMIYTVLASV